MNYAVSGVVVGAAGDVGLQIADYMGKGNEGLKGYFASRPKYQSVAMAAGLTGFWSGVYGYLRGARANWIEFALYAGLLDVFYRNHHAALYPSLAEYYAKNSVEATIAYNMGASLMVSFVAKR